MPLVEHGELVRRALEYILDAHASRPEVSLPALLDEAGMRFNLTPLNTQQLCRLLADPALFPLKVECTGSSNV